MRGGEFDEFSRLIYGYTQWEEWLATPYLNGISADLRLSDTILEHVDSIIEPAMVSENSIANVLRLLYLYKAYHCHNYLQTWAFYALNGGERGLPDLVQVGTQYARFLNQCREYFT